MEGLVVLLSGFLRLWDTDLAAIFPKFLGQGWSIQKQPVWKTVVQQAISGKEVRIALWGVPLWEFTLTYDLVSAAQRYAYGGMVPIASSIITATPFLANDYQAISGFFAARRGAAESWLFDDPNDHCAIQDVVGVGDGGSTQFQAQRHLGEFSEPLRSLNGTPIIASLWQANTSVANGALVIPSVAASLFQGGDIPEAWQTPGWPCWYLGTGGTTGLVEPNWDSARMQGMTIADGSVVWMNQGIGQLVYIERTLGDWTPGSYATNSAILPISNNSGGFTYVASSGGASGGSRPNPFNQSLGGITSDGGVTWVNYGVSHGAVPQLPSVWSVDSRGLITLQSPPQAGVAVRLTTGFYFSCRFLEDIVDFEEFSYKLYKLGKLRFTSIKEPPVFHVDVAPPVSQRNATLAVAADAYNATVTFADLGTASYAVSMSPNWNTTTWWSTKSSGGFVANFNTPAPSDSSGRLDWSVITN